jgi:threonylcarbamoyladenosine tRNA methylthiotransferase MtaB
MTAPVAASALENAAPAEVEVITLGCRLNAYESEAMRALAAGGNEGKVVIVNTCAVTNEAVRQAGQTIRRARRENPGAQIVVTGCAAQIDPAKFAAMPEVNHVLGNAEKMKSESFRDLARRNDRVQVNDIMAVRETAGHLIDGLADRARAYVQVQNGCDHRCTFCIIPYGRGNSRSVPAGEVVEQVRRLAGLGVPEVVLTGVDLTSWGQDLPGQPTLGNLCARILKLVPELKRLRLSSVDACEIDETLFGLFAEEERLMPHLHLSLQHGADIILKRMKRRHLRADALALAARLRAVRPEIAFGADLIAGFPTETQDCFRQTLDLVDEMDLAFLHVFAFSAREGTPAAKMPQLAPSLIRERAARLRAHGETALGRHLDGLVGTVKPVLIEREGRGRLETFTEVEGVAGGAGEIVQARLHARTARTLLAETA